MRAGPCPVWPEQVKRCMVLHANPCTALYKAAGQEKGFGKRKDGRKKATGGSGKSVMAWIATLLAGKDNTTSATIDTLESSREPSVYYTTVQVQSLTPIRGTVEQRAAEHPPLRDVFLCHAWDDHQGVAKELYDLLERQV